MAFDFSCPACNHTTQMDNSASGEMGVCPKCDAEVMIQRDSVVSDPEQLSATSTGVAKNSDIELGSGTNIASRIIMVTVFLCVMSGGGFMIYNGFEIFGYQYKGVVGILEDAPEYGLSDYQIKLLEETKGNKGPPDYSQYAVEPLVRSEEEIRLDEAMTGGEGGFGGDTGDGGEGSASDGQSSGGRSFDPERIFNDRDENMDGLLSGDEISERMQSRVDEMDKDKDGAISKMEFLAAMQRFRDSRQGGRGDGVAPRGDSGAGRPE
ncbi:MAG: hypothetical protein HOB73_08770 [Planctomycetaceae bacterium]|jgi:hypothetical protein|nr:hypothetical protein [Planctomycetaceae bacterium]